MANDFIIELNERYGMSREQINNSIKEFNSSINEFRLLRNFGRKYHYGTDKHYPLIPYEKVEVGHRLYRYPWEFITTKDFEEVEVVHKYGGVIFYVKVEGDDKEIHHVSKNAPAWEWCFYPKVILKPSFIELTCSCPLTEIKNWEED